MTHAQVPLVDFNDWRAGGSQRDRFVQTLGLGLEATGFVVVINHGVANSLIEEAYSVAARTFALPKTVKQAYEDPSINRQRGYTSFAVERAKNQTVGDLKEFWHVGAELPDDHPMVISGDVPKNLYPTELPEFQQTFHTLFEHLQGFAKELLVAIGAHIGVDRDTFLAMVHNDNSVLRVIHYPDSAHVVPGAVRAAQHEDINLLTVLPASTRPGLQLLTRDGEWMEVEAPPGAMVCDTGDMMQLLTGGRLPATTHRVVNPDASDGGRMSMPFFLHPRNDFLLTPMHGDETPITAGEFLRQRLKANGVG